MIDIEERVARLIDAYDLHGTFEQPVDVVNLAPLEEWFPITIADLTVAQISGFVLPIAPESTRPVPITLCRTLDADAARLVYAHEVGHALYGHEGAFTLMELDRWFQDRSEREAWRVAAQLLVPVDAIARYETVDRIASACRVPAFLVEMI